MDGNGGSDDPEPEDCEFRAARAPRAVRSGKTHRPLPSYFFDTEKTAYARIVSTGRARLPDAV